MRSLSLILWLSPESRSSAKITVVIVAAERPSKQAEPTLEQGLSSLSVATEPFQPGKRKRTAVPKHLHNLARFFGALARQAPPNDMPAFWPAPNTELSASPNAVKLEAAEPLWLAGGRVRLRHWPTGDALLDGSKRDFPGLDLSSQSNDAVRNMRGSRVGEVGLRPEHAIQPKDFDDLLRVARSEGYTRLLTIALAPAEARVLKSVGFSPVKHLDVLKRTSTNKRRTFRSSSVAELEHTNETHLAEIFTLDNDGFSEPWKMDAEGFRDALRATPHARWRVAISHGETVGYAITGRSATQGFLQRIVVREDVRRHGIASLLVIDSLRWLAQYRIDIAFVNTESANIGARKLYESFGFELQNDVLTVLEMSVPTSDEQSDSITTRIINA